MVQCQGSFGTSFTKSADRFRVETPGCTLTVPGQAARKPAVRRSLSVLAILAFATQLTAFGGSVLVCRFTGEIMKACCCPDGGGEQTSLAAPCCCDEVGIPEGNFTARLDAPKATVAVVLVALPAPPVAAAAAPRISSLLRPRSTGPPVRGPLYLLERQLLI